MDPPFDAGHPPHQHAYFLRHAYSQSGKGCLASIEQLLPESKVAIIRRFVTEKQERIPAYSRSIPQAVSVYHSVGMGHNGIWHTCRNRPFQGTPRHRAYHLCDVCQNCKTRLDRIILVRSSRILQIMYNRVLLCSPETDSLSVPSRRMNHGSL